MSDRVDAAANVLARNFGKPKADGMWLTLAGDALAAADAAMFSDEAEAWVATITASYGVRDPFACAAEIIAALKGAGNG